jgi:hypothetical protein
VCIYYPRRFISLPSFTFAWQGRVYVWDLRLIEFKKLAFTYSNNLYLVQRGLGIDLLFLCLVTAQRSPDAMSNASSWIRCQCLTM